MLTYADVYIHLPPLCQQEARVNTDPTLSPDIGAAEEEEEEGGEAGGGSEEEEGGGEGGRGGGGGGEGDSAPIEV
jgi:hypothetical protein